MCKKSIKQAVEKAKLIKRDLAHTPFVTSFAIHLLQANYDIRTILQMLGYSDDVRTTLSNTVKEAKSPLLDF